MSLRPTPRVHSPWFGDSFGDILTPVTAPRTTCPRLALALALALGTGQLSCGGELPIAERIATTRVLALRSEVVAPLPMTNNDPELGSRCEALPFEGVRLTPWIVTPTGPLDLSGPDYDPVWIACNLGPGQGLFACLKAAVPLELADIPTCPVPTFADLMAAELPEPPSPCILPPDGSDDGKQDFTVPFASALLIGGDLEITLISRSPGSPSTAECAESLLAGDSQLPDDCLFVVQRVSVGPLEQLLAFAAGFGVMLPPELGEPPPPDQIPDADRNPRILDFTVTRITAAGTPIELGPLSRGAVVKLDLGDTLKISTTTPEADLQDFQVPVNGGAGGSQTQTEGLDGAWFRTWGTLLANGSDDVMSINEWTLRPGSQDEQDAPPDDRATLYYVLRDSRLGVDWWWISVEVPPTTAP